MGLRTRIALLLCLAAAAVYTGGEAESARSHSR